MMKIGLLIKRLKEMSAISPLGDETPVTMFHDDDGQLKVNIDCRPELAEVEDIRVVDSMYFRDPPNDCKETIQVVTLIPNE